MKEFEKLLNQALLPERKDSFLYPFPDSFSYFDVKIDPSSTSFLLNGKQVTKLRLLYQPTAKKFFLDKSPLPANGACCITYQDGSKSVQSIAPEKIEEVRGHFTLHCSNSIQTFLRMNQRSLNWQDHSMRIYYQQQQTNPTQYYSELHEKIMSRIVGITQETKYKGLNIIDGGCGDGQLVKKMENRFKAELAIPVNIMGFDFNTTNVAACQEGYSGSCQFFQGNLLEIDQIIATATAKGWLCSDWPIILTLSGSLTRLVLKDGFQAAEVLMLASASKVDYLIGGGVGEPLVTASMIKRLGYKENQLSSSSNSHNFFSYQHLSEEEIKRGKFAKFVKSNFLDLSLSPYAVDMLIMMKSYLQTNTTIDLSFLPLTRQLERTLHRILDTNSTLKLIFWHHDEPTVKQFIETFFLKAIIDVKVVRQDATLISSPKFFTMLQNRKENYLSEEEIINNFIMDYINANTKPVFDLRKEEMTNLEKAIGRTGKNDIRIEVTDDERLLINASLENMAILKPIMQETVTSLQKSVFAGDLSKLPLLMHWYKQDLPFRIPHNFDIKVEVISELIDEINLYAHLATEHANIFDTQAMKMLAYWAIHTKTTSLSIEREHALERVSLLWPSNSEQYLSAALGS
ncbi:hypothetical protein [Legionella cardiaca]|uniref:Methyltransferase domain-containing protein n=1 Tax=Legionella cardiaca TaxID=1071983 RepID=A0ABY8ANM7_9GAMM|nr:hypothetical protein [Legionella cardiaca]WED42304.1 hypothetical protein PXX05_10230 [Legionella cardiaca]